MSQQLTLPPPEEVAARMRACRDELAALRKLYRAAIAVRAADRARDSRRQASEGAAHAR